MKKFALLVLSVFILCTACIAQAAGNDLPVFASIRDVLDSTECYLSIHDHPDYLVLVLEMDDRHFRMVTLLDDHAKELYKAAEAQDYSTPAMEAFDEYAWTLPIVYTEELSETPISQDELDELKGKTIQELMNNGFGNEMILYESELVAPVSILLEYGSYKYEFKVTNASGGDPYLMTIKDAKYNGFSRSAFDIDIQEILSDP